MNNLCLAGVKLPEKGRCPACHATDAEFCRLVMSRFQRALAVIAEQAEDDGLWFKAETAPEAYLQQELRRLHAVLEGEHAAEPTAGGRAA